MPIGSTRRIRGRKTARVNLAPGDGNTGIEGLRGGPKKRGVAPEPSAPFGPHPLSPSPFRRGGTTEHGSERPAEPGRRDSGDGSAQQVGPVAPAESDVRATLENDDRVAVEPRLDLAHAVEVHERRPADAAKPRFVEPRLDPPGPGAHPRGPAPPVPPHVVTRRLDPVHVRRPPEEA